MKRKKLLTGVLCVFLAAGALAVLCAGLTACGSSWNIGTGGTDEVTATLKRTDDQSYKLTIGGSGRMANWNTPEDVPWHDRAGEITEVVIGDRVLSIGDNAFAGTKIASVVVPDSVELIGRNTIPASADLFVWSEEIEYAEETDREEAFLYREEKPLTDSRYWQSDRDSGDIFDFDNPDELLETAGNYWHYDADDRAVKWDVKRVLFIGNSFTYTNMVPEIFDNVVKGTDRLVETYAITGPGWYLDAHADATDVCGEQVDALLNARDDFDYVVLQEQSTCAFRDYDRFLGGVQALQEKIEATQKDAKIFLYATWGYAKSAPSYGFTIPEMEAAVREGYQNAAKATGTTVSPVGEAFTAVYENEPSVNLYASDNHHQSYAGSYLGACVHAAAVLGVDVRETTYTGTLSEEEAALLREYAFDTVFEEAAIE